MSSMRHDDSDGSDIFWPGYVDAVTNLVLNLLFLLTIMTVAVFMFALELGRASMGGAGKPPSASAVKNGNTVEKSTATDPAKENIALKREIERLNQQLAQQKSMTKQQTGVVENRADASATMPAAPNKITKTLAASDTDIVIRFTDEAVAFAPSERTRIVELLKPIVSRGKATILVEAPAGFSEAKRLGFYRAMAVRNLLLEMRMPKEVIDVTVREGKTGSNPAVVKVRAQ